MDDRYWLEGYGVELEEFWKEVNEESEEYVDNE